MDARSSRMACTLAVAAALAGCGGQEVHLPVAKVERLLPAVRQLRFHTAPEVKVVSKADFAGIAARQFADDAKRLPRAAQAQLKQAAATGKVAAQIPVLLGLVPAHISEQSLAGVAELEGIYDGIANRVYLIRDVLGSDAQKAEAGLAHELTHALEEQSLGPARHRFDGPTSDTLDAERAVREGSATLAEVLYSIRYLGMPGPPGRYIRARPLPAVPGKVARIAQAELEFVYGAGTRFVYTLYRRGGWSLVNRALRRPPAASADILEPRRWLARERPRPPKGSAAKTLRASWLRRLTGDFGAASTAEMLAQSGRIGGPLFRAWEGGTLELWQQPGAGVGKRTPDLRTSTLVIAWRWRRPADVALARRAITGYLARTFHARPDGPGSWSWPAGAAAYASRGATSSLVLGPTPALARAAAADAAAP